MTRYSIEPRDRISVKRHGFFIFAKRTRKDIGVSMSKNVSGKYSLGMFSCLSKSSWSC